MISNHYRLYYSSNRQPNGINMQNFMFRSIISIVLACASIQLYAKTNPLLEKSLFPNFKTIQAQDFAPAIEQALTQYHSRLDTILKSPASWENTIQPLEEETSNFTRVWNIISHLNAVNNTPEIRDAYSKLLPKVTGFYAIIMHNEALYKAYTTIKNSPEYASFSAAQKEVIEQMLLDFKLAGAELNSKDKIRYKKISEQLSEFGNKFSNNVLDATQAWQYHIAPDQEAKLDGLPESTKEAAAEKAKTLGKTGWVLTLDAPCLIAVSSYAKDRQLRQEIYTAFGTLASEQDPDKTHHKWDNAPLIAKILELRQELAVLVGYNNYAEYSLADKEAPDTTTVINFLTDLAVKSKPAAQRELKTLQEFAKHTDKIDNLEAWDVAYYAELYKQQHYGVSQEQIRQYFPANTVLAGLFNTVNILYGINISEVPNPNVWDAAVKLYVIKDRKHKTIGYFYVDLYARELKRSGAWMADYVSRLRFSNGEIQLPIAFINTNFLPGNPGLLTHNDVITLFHEFGHMLQHTLTTTDYPSISGINGVAWDAVELASQFMENWAWQYLVIEDISKHTKTGQDMPKDLFNKLLDSKNYNAGLAMLRQVEFALFDFKLHMHAKEDQNKTALGILNEIQTQIAVMPVPKFDRFPNRFKHIFAGGYAAGYYGYKWAEVLASDAFAAFQENGLFNPALGDKFLTTFLQRGGEESTLDLFIQFRGREPSIDPLLRDYGILNTKS